MRRKLNKKNCAIFIANVICWSLFLWLCASYIDTITHNMPYHTHYQDFADWNFFTIIDWTAIVNS